MTKQYTINHRTIPNIAPTLRGLFRTELHITTRQCPTHHKAMSHSIQSDAPIPLGECLQTEIQPITRQWLTHCRTVSNPLEDRCTKNKTIAIQCPTHYRTTSHPLGDCSTQKSNSLQDNVPILCLTLSLSACLSLSGFLCLASLSSGVAGLSLVLPPSLPPSLSASIILKARQTFCRISVQICASSK